MYDVGLGRYNIQSAAAEQCLDCGYMFPEEDYSFVGHLTNKFRNRFYLFPHLLLTSYCLPAPHRFQLVFTCSHFSTVHTKQNWVLSRKLL